MTRKSGQNTEGTFALGNTGKLPGTRHRVTQAVLALLDGEAEALTRKAVQMALSGDGTAPRLCLERIAPPRRDAPVAFPLPVMIGAADAGQGAAAVLSVVAAGDAIPTKAAHRVGFEKTYRCTLETTVIEHRLAALEDGSK